MMRLLLAPLFMLLLLVFNYGCKDNDGGSEHCGAATSVPSVTIVDKGAVVPNPLSTTVNIDSHTIQFCQEQSGQIKNSWSNSIQPGDFDAVQQVITDNNLIGSPDVVLPPGAVPCTGWRGLTITLAQQNIVYVINVDGGVCSKTDWPTGIQELVSLQDNLVLKYQP